MAVLRCNVEGATTQRVRVHMEQFGVVDDEMALDPTSRRIKLGIHADVVNQADGRVLEVSPEIDNEADFEGELCSCELKFLRGLPGFTFSRDLRFTVAEI